MIPIKTADEIMKMRDACRVASEILDRLVESTHAGMTTMELEMLARKFILELGAESACFQYPGIKTPFPNHICISVNEELVHGIGKDECVLKDGDLVSIDVVIRYKDFIADNACTVIVGTAEEKLKKLVRVTEEALIKGIEKALPGNSVGDISHAIQEYVEKNGFSVVRDFVGHGVGKLMHEEPQIPNFGKRGKGPKLAPGMTLAIEPMVNLGRHDVKYAKDAWTVVTCDKKPSAHAEHTILITNEKPEILTFSKKREKMLELI